MKYSYTVELASGGIIPVPLLLHLGTDVENLLRKGIYM
jgi:hypothetical protein